MNEKGEKTCPLCAEEMDLTDQHLKPCKCGYQICVWCWHHIIEMAEKDKTEGRCPACRTPYDKEKIVGMTVSCERLVAELNNDRKKSQKVKPKPSEGRKDLTGVRVIQRNLVYVMSLPFDLADENLFQRREYFGQYGKVVKVAMSRTASGAVQQFPNNTCSVYITYSREEEAIRCIRSVHGFILDGRNLKACFGTMKYCHAWLRNTTCTNSECLYLHEIGSQEDSFSKDETISVHMRRMVQQITGGNNYVRRSGSMLPPPVDDYFDNESSTRKIPKVVLNNAHSVAKSSPPNDSNGQSVTLPAGALWGMHSSSQSSVPNTPCSREPLRDKAATVSSAVVIHSDVLKKPGLEDSRTADENVLKPQSLLDGQTDFPELSVSNRTQISSRAGVSASVDNSRAVSEPSDCKDFPEQTSQSCRSMLSNGNNMSNRRIQSVCSDVVSVDADSVVDGYHGITRSDNSHFDHASIMSSHTEVSQDHTQRFVNEPREVQPLQKSGRTNANEIVVSREEVNAGTALMSPFVRDRYLEADDDISLFNRQRLKDPEVLSCQPNGFLRTYNAEHDETRTVFGSSYSDSRGSTIAPISHGYTEMPLSEPNHLNGSVNHSFLLPDKARDTQPIGKSVVDLQENSRSEIDDRIMENILSLDLDEYLTSPHNFAKLFGEGDEDAKSLKLASSSKVEDNQSRFSFARQEESKNQAFDAYNGFNQIPPIPHGSDFYQNNSERQSANMGMFGTYNGLSSVYRNGIDYVTQSSALPSSYTPTSAPRCPVSAPPGFSVPNRPPPPGFASNGREHQTFDGLSGNHRYSDSTFFGNTYQQSLPVDNVRDVQFMDPAILAVGQGFENASLDFRSNFQGNTNMFGNPAKLHHQQQQQAVMQSPLSPHQNCRFTDSLGMASSRLIDQSQGSNILSRNLALPNGHWDGLMNNEIQTRNRLQTCTNSECLYLHEIGSQEDSFSKDETISVHMRRMVQQITGGNNYVRRSGSMLPPPVDDYFDNESSTRKIPKVVLNNAHSVAKSSPPNDSNGQSVTLPAGALWGMHSSSQSSVPNTPCSREPLRDKAATVSSAVVIHSDVLKKPGLEDSRTADENVLKPQSLLDGQTDFPELSVSNRTQISSRAGVSASVDNSRAVSEPSDCKDFPEQTSQSCRSMLSNGNNMSNRRIQSVCSDVVSVDADSVVDGYHGITRSDNSHFDHASIMSSHTEVSQDHTQRFVNEPREVQPLQKSGRTNANEIVVSREEVNAGTALMSPFVRDRYLEADDDISLFNRQRLKDPEVLSCQPNGFLRTYNAEHDETRTVFGSSYSDSRGSTIAPISHGYTEMPLSEPNHLNGSVNHSFLLPDKARDTQPIGKSVVDLQENSRSEIDDRIMENILSLDLDEYLTSPHNFAKLFGEGDEDAKSLKLASSSKVEDNQSRFSFARQEESKNQAFDAYNGFNQIPPIPHGSDFYQNNSERQSANMGMFGTYNGLSSVYRNGIDYVTQSSALPSSYTPTSAPRCPVSAPPGFSVPNRPPPPGFASNGREHQTFDGLSGNHRYSDSTFFGNTYQQSLPVDNVRDVQFMDPAILAVGQGFENASLDFRSNFQGNTNMFGNPAKLHHQQQQQAVMQSPLSPHQNCRFTDSLGMASSRLIDQSQGSNILSRNLALPNGHWDGLMNNEIQTRNRLQNDRLVGSANYIPGYNGTFRI